jgi:Protein of unknown function (DUF4031)
MSVYVDGIVHHPNCGLPFEHWCHMRADSEEELHLMAAEIGLKREWFQDRPGAPHYDLNPEARVRAIELGAIPLSRREWVTKFPLKKRPVKAST